MLKKLISKIYEAIVFLRNEYYDTFGPSTKLDCTIISVGNLTVGGTGKTPFVEMLVKYLIYRNKKTIVIGRGYKKREKGIIEVSNGSKILSTAEECGDEMLLLAKKLNVPIFAGESKSQTASFAYNKYKPDCIIIDDGFQHRKLKRNIDIVIIDKDTIENPYLLPKGRLREPLKSINRANIIVQTIDAKLNADMMKHLKDDVIITQVNTYGATAYDFVTKEAIKSSIYNNSPIKIIAFAGIAQPFRFFNMIKLKGYNVIEQIEFADHYQYSKDDISNLIDKAINQKIHYLATTEKDAVKLDKFKDILNNEKIKLIIFPIKSTILEGEKNFFQFIARRI